MVGGVTTTPAHRGDDLDLRAGVVLAIVGFAIIGLSTPASGTRLRPGRRARPLLAPSSRSRSSTCCRSSLLIVLRSAGAAVPRHLRQRALRGRPGACFTQPSAVAAFVGEPTGRRSRRRSRRDLLGAGQRVRPESGNETIDTLFSRGGMASMLYTIWLVLGALLVRGRHGGRRLPRAADPSGARRATPRGASLPRWWPTCLGLNIVAGDQYVAIVMPQPHLSGRVRPSRPRAADAVAGGGGLGHRHVAPRSVE